MTVLAAAPAAAAALAAGPLLLLAALVLGSRLKLAASAAIVVALTVALAIWPFQLQPAGIGNAVAKGLLTGLYILLIVLPALLLFEVAERSGALSRLSDGVDHVAPTTGRRLLLVGWVFPSFLQGAAGFGTPIAVAAPMLVRSGVQPVTAVALCLIGYHWSVTFGSMGSSFFVAAGTARLDAAATLELAARVSALLAVNCVAAGLLLLRRVPGRAGAREALPPALGIAAVMILTLLAVVRVQPALGSTLAGLAGLAAAVVLLPLRDAAGTQGGERAAAAASERRAMAIAAVPYLALTALVSIGFGVPAVRAVLERVPELAIGFPAAGAAFGHSVEPEAAHSPISPLLHPGPYLLAAAAIAAFVYQRAGWWRSRGSGTLSGWWRRSQGTFVSVLALTVVASLMVDAGMIAALADRLAAALQIAYTAVAPALGMVGTIITGSTTASNALLAPLQVQVAGQLELGPTLLLAGQAAGGNVGNILAPVNILVGAVAAGCAGREGDVIRASARDALVLLVLVVVGVLAQIALAGGFSPSVVAVPSACGGCG